MASGKLGSLRISHCSAACDKQTKAVRVRTCIPFASRLGRFACCEGGSPVPSHCDSVSTAAMSATHQDANHEHFLHFLPSFLGGALAQKLYETCGAEDSFTVSTELGP